MIDKAIERRPPQMDGSAAKLPGMFGYVYTGPSVRHSLARTPTRIKPIMIRSAATRMDSSAVASTSNFLYFYTRLYPIHKFRLRPNDDRSRPPSFHHRINGPRRPLKRPGTVDGEDKIHSTSNNIHTWTCAQEPPDPPAISPVICMRINERYLFDAWTKQAHSKAHSVHPACSSPTGPALDASTPQADP